MNYYKCEYCHDYYDEDGNIVNGKQFISLRTFADATYNGEYYQQTIHGVCQVEDIGEKFVCEDCENENN